MLLLKNYNISGYKRLITYLDLQGIKKQCLKGITTAYHVKKNGYQHNINDPNTIT